MSRGAGVYHDSILPPAICRVMITKSLAKCIQADNQGMSRSEYGRKLYQGTLDHCDDRVRPLNAPVDYGARGVDFSGNHDVYFQCSKGIISAAYCQKSLIVSTGLNAM